MTALKHSTLTVLTDSVSTVDATWHDDHPLVTAEVLPALLGWELKPEGLCRDSSCVPLSDRSAIQHASGIDLVAVVAALGCPSVIDSDAGLAVIGISAGERNQALQNRIAPDFTLPDLNGKLRSLSDWSGEKRLLVTFASW